MGPTHAGGSGHMPQGQSGGRSKASAGCRLGVRDRCPTLVEAKKGGE